ncbi:MAG: GNAT family N-acetyltransferase [Rhizobiales bacterium]|nr:GNAT family N-acetyltransferase [Hyphomicrobiales bacterium]MBO6699446.1 GNAT family N-acetyltransferase [Hyphomicrobiales bacterium]MBO6736984.1 GNAT family N-acetyltransferase [Hyphomicrobiales bacterium]MBO6911942.1 GNAT family N-acetyltransferase [Hyphomicrobiales bacterium]MBO6957069.1 GNAT family N-acetyltransferase [Hyphomicrobiales bacterium]
MSTPADIPFAGTATAPRVLTRSRAETPTASTRYASVEVTTRDAVMDLKDEWQRLEQISEGSAVFQSFDLCLPWLDAYVFGDAPTHQAHVLAIYNQAGTMVALAPFAQKISGLVNMAEWIGDPLVQYGDILMDPAADRMALRAVLSDALGSWRVGGLHLRNVREDSRIAQVLDLSTTAVGEARVAALADFTQFDDVEGYFATFSKRSKKNRKTKRRKLAEQGELSFDVVKAGAEGADYCALALKWKIAWLAERGLSSRAFMDARALGALQEACSRQSDHNPIRLFVQRVDDEPVAIEIGLLGPLGNAAFMGTYDPAYENLSAGKVQMESSVMHGFDDGWAGYDMLAPMSDYKQSWSNRTVSVADHIVPTGMLGLIYRDGYLRGARPLMKMLWNALPSSVRALVLRKGGGLAAL